MEQRTYSARIHNLEQTMKKLRQIATLPAVSQQSQPASTPSKSTPTPLDPAALKLVTGGVKAYTPNTPHTTW